MCSRVSTALTRKTGVDVFFVDFRGSDRFIPQSPRARPEGVVMMACDVGYGSVAVSDTRFDCTWPSRSFVGRARGGGRENSRELRNKLAVGESLLLDMVRLEKVLAIRFCRFRKTAR